MRFNSFRCIVLLTLFAAPQVSQLQGQVTRQWINTTGSSSTYFDVSGNWSPAATPRAEDTVLFNIDADYQVLWDSQTPGRVPSVTSLEVTAGDVYFLNNESTRYELDITGYGANNYNFRLNGVDPSAFTRLGVKGLQLNTEIATINNGRLELLGDSSAGTLFTARSRFTVGFEGAAWVYGGAALEGSGGSNELENFGDIRVVDDDSLIKFRDAYLGEQSRLELYDGGDVVVENRLEVGNNLYTVGPAEVRINGAGSTLTSLFTFVGTDGWFGTPSAGRVIVENGGRFDSNFLNLGSEGEGQLLVSGTGSVAESGFLTVGGNESGLVEISNGGVVRATTFSNIRDKGQVILHGGQFEFQSLDVLEYARISGSRGTLAGTVVNDVTSYRDASLLQNALNDSAVLVRNSGTLFGSTNTQASLLNRAGSELQTFTGEQMRFGGTGVNEANAEINNFGGLIRFDGSLTNEAGGFIGGQGTFIANGGLINAGVLAITGDSNILGDIVMQSGSQLVTSGFATTTLFDDLIHNGSEIRTSNGSALVVLGGAMGSVAAMLRRRRSS